MAGLMAGSLRALWPWKAETAPYTAGDITVPAILMVVGAAFVLGMMLLDRRAAHTGIDRQD